MARAGSVAGATGLLAIPGEYYRFCGRVILMDASAPPEDEAVRATVEAFSRTRFEATFPEAAKKGLPLLVGLDMEWRPDKGFYSDNAIALVQVACWDTTVLVRTVGCSEMPTWLRDLLEDDAVVKVTASFDVADKAKLKRSFGWEVDKQAKASSFLDVAELAKVRDIPFAMRKMSHFFSVPMLKRKTVGCSDWASEDALTPEQLEYAADDAFFTLYLAGLVLAQPIPAELQQPPAADEATHSRVLEAYSLLRPQLDKSLKCVDNSEYRTQFLELREIVKEAVRCLSNMLGAGGSTNMSSIQSVKSVQKALLNAQKKCTLQLGVHFLKQNCDIFHIFCEDGDIRVKLRPEEADAQLDEATLEDDAAFVTRVLESLAFYKPPIGKRETTTNYHVPEPAWVPARALLKDAELARFESCLASVSLESVESSYCEPDGLLLRLLRHPHAADASAHIRCCVDMLQEGGLSTEEASARLLGDTKFAQLSKSLKLVGSGTPEERQIFRSLRARARMLMDSHVISLQVPASWRDVYECLEKSKRYRKTLGTWLASFDKGGDEAAAARGQPMRDFLNAAVVAWPDIDRADVVPGDAGKAAGSPPKRPPAPAAAESGQVKRRRVGFGEAADSVK